MAESHDIKLTDGRPGRCILPPSKGQSELTEVSIQNNASNESPRNLRPPNINELLILLQLIGFTTSEHKKIQQKLSEENAKAKCKYKISVTIRCSSHKERSYKLSLPIHVGDCSCKGPQPGAASSENTEAWYTDYYLPFSTLSQELINYCRVVIRNLTDWGNYLRTKDPNSSTLHEDLPPKQVFSESTYLGSVPCFSSEPTYSELRSDLSNAKIKEYFDVAVYQIKKGTELLDALQNKFPDEISELKIIDIAEEEKQAQAMALKTPPRQLTMAHFSQLDLQSGMDISLPKKSLPKAVSYLSLLETNYTRTKEHTPIDSLATKQSIKQNSTISEHLSTTSLSGTEEQSHLEKQSVLSRFPRWMHPSFRSKRIYRVEKPVVPGRPIELLQQNYTSVTSPTLETVNISKLPYSVKNESGFQLYTNLVEQSKLLPESPKMSSKFETSSAFSSTTRNALNTGTISKREMSPRNEYKLVTPMDVRESQLKAEIEEKLRVDRLNRLMNQIIRERGLDRRLEKH